MENVHGHTLPTDALKIASNAMSVTDHLEQIRAVVCCLGELLTYERHELPAIDGTSLYGLSVIFTGIEDSLKIAIDDVPSSKDS